MPYAQSSDSTYGRNCFVYFAEDNETSEDFGISLAAKFTNYANQSDAFIGSKNKFIYQKEKTLLVEKPVNYYLYLCDRDPLLLLKKIYGGNGVKKIDIENDTEVLGKFFQDVQQSIQLLTMLTEDQWQHLTS